MIKLRHIALFTTAVAAVGAPAASQVGGAPISNPGSAGGPAAPLPGSGNGVGMADSLREENASYNRVIGKVGANPVAEETAKRSARAKPVPATPADVVPGAAVRDVAGAALGKVESIDGDSAILVYSSGKIRFPLVGFGKDSQGLLINLSTKDFLALVEKARASS